jgi:rod shape-determining protein MreC
LQENSLLHSQLTTAYSKLSEIKINILDTNIEYSYKYKSADVINNTVDKPYNFLTLNIGKLQGIDEKMGVISDNGVVGIIKNSSNNFSVAISILNRDFRLNAKIQEIGEVGSIIWDGSSPEYVILQEIPNHVKVKIGQHIVVGPFSGFFPENYPIGIIVDYKLPKGASFYQIYIRLNTNMKNNSSVYVIKKIKIEEQQRLEKQSINE